MLGQYHTASEYEEPIYAMSSSESEAGGEKDLENPLSQGHDAPDYGSTEKSERRPSIIRKKSTKELFITKSYSWMGTTRTTVDFDAAHYDLSLLTSWNTFLQTQGSFMDQKSLWFMISGTVVIAISIALITVYTPAITHARAAATSKLSTFLNIYMGMLLGFFIASTVQRWFGCSAAFLSLLDAVRNLQMQCFALGVPTERVDKICRYGVLSARLLYKFHYTDVVADESSLHRYKLWEELEAEWPGLVSDEERKYLKDSKCPYALLWTWVASLIGRMAQDGEIPPMPSPTYGRILNLVQNAHGSIRQVREYVTVQLPFLYTHTLAVLVHANNIFNAINLGVTTGFTLRVYVHSWTHSAADQLPDGTVTQAVEALVVGFFMSLLAPMFYQTLLLVGFCFMQPLSNYHTRLPVMRFLKALENDLHEAAVLAENPPYWEKPSFKKK